MSADTFNPKTVIHVQYGMIDHVITMVCTMIFWRFLLNLIDAILLGRKRGWNIVRTLNVVPNAIGTLTLICVMGQQLLPGIVNCTVMMAMNATALSVGLGSVTAVLFVRAYYSWMQERWLCCVGIVIVAVNIVIGILSFPLTSIAEDPSGQCWITLSDILIFSKAGVDTVTNAFLSGMYLLVLRRMIHDGISVKTYRRLYREGVLDTFVIIGSNWLTLIIVSLQLVPGYDAYIYGADLVFSTTIICRMLGRVRRGTIMQLYTPYTTQLTSHPARTYSMLITKMTGSWETQTSTSAITVSPRSDASHAWITARDIINGAGPMLFPSVANAISNARDSVFLAHQSMRDFYDPNISGETLVDVDLNDDMPGSDIISPENTEEHY